MKTIDTILGGGHAPFAFEASDTAIYPDLLPSEAELGQVLSEEVIAAEGLQHLLWDRERPSCVSRITESVGRVPKEKK